MYGSINVVVGECQFMETKAMVEVGGGILEN